MQSILLVSHEVVAVLRRQRALVAEAVQQRGPVVQREVTLAWILAPVFLLELRRSSQHILEWRALYAFTATAPPEHPRCAAVSRPAQDRP